ncbi:hypothetical protein ACFQ3K_06930 [Brucella gallinifaecis]|uniref:Transposase n=1 Tax=Brucella gallinifaecis TaxID=215590 RepID=A0A502BJV5_9HYPH|nr:hypothetical protein FHY56_14905 [Brucella gallinifaecis]
MTNWPIYEAGLRQRDSLTCWVNDDVLAAWRASRHKVPGVYAYLAMSLLSGKVSFKWTPFRSAFTRFAIIKEAIEAAGAQLRYMLPDSPDLNPTEMAFSKLYGML